MLFSGASAVRPGDFDPCDPLLNGHSIAEPVSAAAAATAAPQAWAESPVGHHGAAPAYQPRPAGHGRRISLNPLRSSRLLISRQRGKPHRRRISLSQRRINSRFTIRVPVNLRRRPISLSQRRISSRLTIRMPVNLRRRPISLSQRRISSRLTIRMPVNLHRRPISLSQRRISSRLTIRMPVSLRRRPISLEPAPYQQPVYDPYAGQPALSLRPIPGMPQPAPQPYPAAGLRPACRPARAAAVSAGASGDPHVSGLRRQFPAGPASSPGPGRAGGSETSAALLFRGSGREAGARTRAVGLLVSANS